MIIDCKNGNVKLLDRLNDLIYLSIDTHEEQIQALTSDWTLVKYKL